MVASSTRVSGGSEAAKTSRKTPRKQQQLGGGGRGVGERKERCRSSWLYFFDLSTYLAEFNHLKK